jgi:anti-anti-sigma factor
MTQLMNSKDNQDMLKISDTISIYEVSKIHEKLIESLTEKTTLHIDLGGVNSCDLTCIQLLLTLKKTCKKRGKYLVISNISKSILETARLAGVQENMLLDDPI